MCHRDGVAGIEGDAEAGGVLSIPFFNGCLALAADLVPEALHVHVAAVCGLQHLLSASSSTRRKHAAQQVRRQGHPILQSVLGHH